MSYNKRRSIVDYMNRKRQHQHRYSYLLDDENDLNAKGKEPVGFLANSRARLNRKHRDDRTEVPGQRTVKANDNDEDSVFSSSSCSTEKDAWTSGDLGQLFKHLNSYQANLDGRCYIPAALSCQKEKNDATTVEQVDNATETDSSEDESSIDSTTRTSHLLKTRLVRFADEIGLPLIQTTLFDDDDVDRSRRLIILLLSPSDRKFEFVHASYKVSERITIADIILQLPMLASNEILASQRYIGLCRVRHGYQELINHVAVQNCELGQDEVLIAIAEGCKGKDLVKTALPIFKSRNIVRAVKNAKRSGRAVQTLQSGVSMEQSHAVEAKKEEERHPNYVEMPPTIDECEPVEQPSQRRIAAGTAGVSNETKEPSMGESENWDQPVIPTHVPLSSLVNTGVAAVLTYFILSAHKIGR